MLCQLVPGRCRIHICKIYLSVAYVTRNFGYGSILLLNIVCAPCEVDVPDENLLCDLPWFKLVPRIRNFSVS
jgi:hypothetical protein